MQCVNCPQDSTWISADICISILACTCLPAYEQTCADMPSKHYVKVCKYINI